MKMTQGKGWTLSSVDVGHPAPKQESKANPNSPKPNIRVEKRAGKAVTVIAGLHTYGTERLTGMAKDFKRMFGAGGTVKDGAIEIQGDRADAIREWFAKQKKNKD